MYCTCTVQEWTATPSPSCSVQRERVNFSCSQLVGGQILPVELFRVIIPPLFSLIEVLAPPPSSFCPALVTGSPWRERVQQRRQAKASLLSACLLVLGAMLHLTLGNKMQRDRVLKKICCVCVFFLEAKRDTCIEIQAGNIFSLFDL